MTVAAWTVLVSASLLAYAYLVYPLLVLLLARLFPGRCAPAMRPLRRPSSSLR